MTTISGSQEVLADNDVNAGVDTASDDLWEDTDDDEQEASGDEDENLDEDDSEDCDGVDEDLDSDDQYGMWSDEDNYAGPLELDVEETVTTLSKSLDSQVTMKLYRGDDDDGFEGWMQTFVATCSREGKEIGRAFGRYVRRSCIRHNFWLEMEQPCQELSSIAFSLFDRYGRLKEEYITHPIRKGSGYWGRELDLGDLFIIEDVLVDKDHRREGVGAAIVECLIARAKHGNRRPDFIIVKPGWLGRDIDKELERKAGLSKRDSHRIRIQAVDAADAFYRSLGFRRIGGSGCFGLALDAHHKTRSLTVADDFDPLEPDLMTESEDIEEEDDFYEAKAQAKALKKLEERLPLHHAAVSYTDDKCVEVFETFKIANHVDTWAKADRFGNNVLHQAALELKPETVRWLVDNVDDSKVLSSTRNRKGYTPLEALINRLEKRRNTGQHGMIKAVRCDFFEGFSDDAVNCIATLRDIKAPSEIQNLQIKFGCSCGGCIDGFLSPRMGYALLCEAEQNHDLLMMDVDDADQWCELLEHLNEHAGPNVRQDFYINKDLRLEVSHIFDAVATTLRAQKVPNTINVMDTRKSSSESRLNALSLHKSAVESVIRIVFDSARDRDQWAGDGMHMYEFGEDVELLPECRNDHEFAFVAAMCGIPGLGHPDHMEWRDMESDLSDGAMGDMVQTWGRH